MSDFNLKFQIYDYKSYIKELEKDIYDCSSTFYPGKATIIESTLMSNLLKLSKRRCFMCGHTLEINNFKNVYFEREHLINKKINNSINEGLLRCRYNIVPICKICNLSKIKVNISDELALELKKLEEQCQKHRDNMIEIKQLKKQLKLTRINDERRSDLSYRCIRLESEIQKCKFYDCMNMFKIENFDFNLSSYNYKSEGESVQFDFLAKTFYGDLNYINQFGLNDRTDILFDDIFKLLYNTKTSLDVDPVSYVKIFSKSTLDDELIDWLDDSKILNDSSKRENLIEVMTLFENL